MAGRNRQSNRVAATGSSSRRKRSGGTSDDVPEIYRQMLSDSSVRPNAESSEPPRKRRKPGQRNQATQAAVAHAQPEYNEGEAKEEDEEDGIEFEDVGIPAPQEQTIYRDSDDDDGSDSEPEFEDVDLSFLQTLSEVPPGDDTKEIKIDLPSDMGAGAKQMTDRRKPISQEEKDRRLAVHKTHLLCLLSHAARRNSWCNDAAVQETLQELFTDKMIKFLHPGKTLTQFGRSESFKRGLQQVEDMFKLKFQITERGSRRALWAENEDQLANYQIPEDADSVMEKKDFRDAARTLKGSRDIGAQLYCALLRSAGLEARLICSLQPLSFASGGPTMARTSKSKQRPSLEEQQARRLKYDSSFETPGLGPTFSARRRLGHPGATAFEPPPIATLSSPAPAPRKTIRECSYPIYWVEVLDDAHLKWQPVDPLVTHSYGKPKLFEPPATERENSLAYVIGFEADGTAKDVTRRYAKAYNSKTRKLRVESIVHNGDRWWRKALRPYRRVQVSDLDQVEDGELMAAELREGMPKNVADFKDHPVYALERHFRRHEVLIPGAATTGTVAAGNKGPLEKVYRRKDVRVARTREKWYRLGREVRGNEIPAKFLPKPVKRAGLSDDPDDGDTVGTPIFTQDQTELYKPPPIVDGIIPKNRYGNLDIYVPSMVPDGGAYVPDDLAAQAAFTLGVDYAPALTGFQFKGRKGTAVLHGAVVAAEHEDGVRVVIVGLKELEQDMEQERRTREVLRTWKRFLMNLRIRQRIFDGAEPDEAASPDDKREQEVVEAMAAAMDDNAPDEDQAPTEESELEGGFIVDDDDGYGGGF